ncbi:9776_t:CDS:2, partial [Cetraspora pellucida]
MKKKEREKLYKENNIPDCDLCKSKHFKCKSKKCDDCCNLNKCVSYPCEYCKNNNIECEYSIIKTKEKFNELEKLGLSAYVAQLEYTSGDIVHVQAYCQFKKRLTRTKIKDLFKNSTISFPEKMRGDTKSNIYYATKKYNKCKWHDKNGCTCHYFDNEDYRCRVCNDKCPVRTKCRIDGLQSLVGPFQYGVFRMLGSNEDDEIVNGNEHDRERIKAELKGGRFWFPIVFYLWGPGGSGKTGLVTELFGDELYDKPEKGRSGSNCMVNVLNDGKIKVQSKYGGFEFMVAKYIFMTSTKPPKDAYNF